MLEIASFEEILSTSRAVRGYVDTHDSTPFHFGPMKLDVLTTPLVIPRIIGEKEAKFLRLAKGVSGGILASAVYEEEGMPHSVTGENVGGETLRIVIVRAEGPATYQLNGNDDASEHALTSLLAHELIEDIPAA